MPLDMNQLRVGKIEVGTHCNVYRNLNLLKYGVVGWSIQCYVEKKLKVVQHAKCVLLSNVKFKHATEAQEKRCESVREVCAWLKGTYQASCLSRDGVPNVAQWEKPPAMTGLSAEYGTDWRHLRCDPKVGEGKFHDALTKEVLEEVGYVFVDNEGKAWYLPKEEADGGRETAEHKDLAGVC